MKPNVNIINITSKLEAQKYSRELSQILKDVDSSHPDAPAIVEELQRFLFRLELLQLCIDRGYQPLDFLVNPGAEQ